jgi:hypothetical protein
MREIDSRKKQSEKLRAFRQKSPKGSGFVLAGNPVESAIFAASGKRVFRMRDWQTWEEV